LGAAQILEKSHSNIRFFIAGAGFQEDKVKEYEKYHSNLKYFGRLSKEELLNVYSLSDLGCIQHIKGATQSVTYKLFDLLSCGLPILNSLESEMKDLIINNQVGLHNSPGDYNQLAKNILDFYNDKNKLQTFRENGYSLTKKKGDSKIVYAEFVNLLENLNNSSEGIHSKLS
jgi:glycosyltransferase involved in cell wall biosynthesis